MDSMQRDGPLNLETFPERRDAIMQAFLDDFVFILKHQVRNEGPMDEEALQDLYQRYIAYRGKYLSEANKACAICLEAANRAVTAREEAAIQRKVLSGQCQRRDFLTRLLVSATYGHFGTRRQRAPLPVIHGIQRYVALSLGQDQFADLNVQCKLMADALTGYPDHELWHRVLQDQVYGYVFSLILMRILLTFCPEQGKDRFLKILRSQCGAGDRVLVAETVFDRLFYSWFVEVKDLLDENEYCERLDAELGVGSSSRLKNVVRHHWENLRYEARNDQILGDA